MPICPAIEPRKGTRADRHDHDSRKSFTSSYVKKDVAMLGATFTAKSQHDHIHNDTAKVREASSPQASIRHHQNDGVSMTLPMYEPRSKPRT